MQKSISTNSANKLNKRFKQIFKNNPTLRGGLIDAKFCNDIAINLYNLRMTSGLTQKDLAERLDVKQSNISRWEQPGYQGYKVKMLSKIVRTLGGKLVIEILPPNHTYRRAIVFRMSEEKKITAVNTDGSLISLSTSRKMEGIVHQELKGAAHYANV
jgi:transcriptional regulator with XRE-family HTH domain